jgi:hypothetical protein
VIVRHQMSAYGGSTKRTSPWSRRMSAFGGNFGNPLATPSCRLMTARGGYRGAKKRGCAPLLSKECFKLGLRPKRRCGAAKRFPRDLRFSGISIEPMAAFLFDGASMLNEQRETAKKRCRRRRTIVRAARWPALLGTILTMGSRHRAPRAFMN